MSILKISKVENFAVFKNFEWDKCVYKEDTKAPLQFKHINIIYGRNYSGKTTLSRIARAIETGEISDKIVNPVFCVDFEDGTQATQSNLLTTSSQLRVFNEDFVSAHLHFTRNPEEGVAPFAILGADNFAIETEINRLESELGCNEEGKESGLYASLKAANLNFSTSKNAHDKASSELENKLKTKSTDRTVGIKYKPERFGNQNYNIRDLQNDISKVLQANYSRPTITDETKYDTLLKESALNSIATSYQKTFQFFNLSDEAKILVSKSVAQSDKIEELLNNAILNRWVNEGRKLHEERKNKCAFCDSTINSERWIQLEKHFDEESEKLEGAIENLIKKIESEKIFVSNQNINKKLFYFEFQERVEKVSTLINEISHKYLISLDALLAQIKLRKDNLVHAQVFSQPPDYTQELINAWKTLDDIQRESNAYTASLESRQREAKNCLRLIEVYDFLVTIGYSSMIHNIKQLKDAQGNAEKAKQTVEHQIKRQISLLAAEKRKLNDEEQGARKVNEYLTNFFGNRFLSLEAVKNTLASDDLPRIRFEIMRNGEKAYHLSEGERNMLAFCYFLAKLKDIVTKGIKPIVWIDDPVSSLDNNHIFFIYSLLQSEIVSQGEFRQLFISTHSLTFLKYLKRLSGDFKNHNGKDQEYEKIFFVVERKDTNSAITVMPLYLQEYITEFNYLFHQIYKCAFVQNITDKNYTVFYNFGNNARKFLEIYLYYRFPDGITEKRAKRLQRFFEDEKIYAFFIERMSNEYSHLSGIFERGEAPIDEPEMQAVARKIIEKLQKDSDQYEALCKSVGEDHTVTLPTLTCS